MTDVREALEAVRDKLERPLRRYDHGHRCDFRIACRAAIQSIDARLAALDTEAEPVAYAPMLIAELPDGAFYGNDESDHPGRILAYRTREQAEEDFDEEDEVIVPLYTHPARVETNE